MEACLGPSREDRALIPGSDSRPADLLIPHWSDGKDAAMDVVNPFQAAVINGAAATHGHALTKKYDEKMKKYGEGCRRAGISLLPSAHGDTGWWHRQTVSQVKRIGSALARQTGGDEGECIRHLAQRLAVLLAKYNFALFLNRFPTFSPTSIDGIE